MSETHGEGLGKELKKRFLLASAWAIANSIASQAIRFASNLVLSRLLFPEAFGMMALVSAVMSGLEMFTDVGIGPSIITKPDPTRRFLDTVWSLQLIRGWGQWAILVIIAYPMSRWYGEPQLVYLIPAIGLISIIRGYAHTSPFTLNQKLKQRELFQLELTSYIVGLLVSAIAAYEMRNVWALVIGGLADALAWSILTYWLTAEPRRHWCWDRDVLKSIRGFSYWILFSTMINFITTRGNRLIFGSFASMSSLGLYSIANGIAGTAFALNSLVANSVLFPLYVEIGRETTPLLKRRVTKLRLAMMGVALPPLWALACFGDWVVRLLWDPRYHDAGPMVQILSGAGVFLAFGAGPLYLARGEAWVGFVWGGVQAAVLFPAMTICQWVQRRYGVWVPWLDAAGFGSSVVFITLGFLLRFWLHF